MLRPSSQARRRSVEGMGFTGWLVICDTKTYTGALDDRVPEVLHGRVE
jgi:hypothetical protein